MGAGWLVAGADMMGIDFHPVPPFRITSDVPTSGATGVGSGAERRWKMSGSP